MSHPTGEGSWFLATKRARAISPGHTALDAWNAARLLLGSESFSDVQRAACISDKPVPEPMLLPEEPKAEAA